MNLLWIAFAIGFPILVCDHVLTRILEVRGPTAFEDPGGWRFPIGEVALIVAFLLSFLFVVLIDYTLNLPPAPAQGFAHSPTSLVK